MRLSCKQGMQIAVYSAMFGRTQQGTLECPLHRRGAPSVGEAPVFPTKAMPVILRVWRTLTETTPNLSLSLGDIALTSVLV